MANNIVQQIDRLVDSRINNGTGDVLPGMSVASGTGQATYGGNVGSRVALDSASIRYNSTVGTLYGGIYQYVFMTYTTTQPARGQLVFWDLSVSDQLYQVNGDAKPSAAIPTLIAGVVIQTTVTKNTYAWMQIAGRASVSFITSPTLTTAGYGVTAGISASPASTCDNGTVLAASSAGALQGVDTLIGISEATVTGAAISLVQLNSSLIRRI